MRNSPSKVSAQTPEVSPETPEVGPETPEVGPETPKMSSRTKDILTICFWVIVCTSKHRKLFLLGYVIYKALIEEDPDSLIEEDPDSAFQ